MDNNLNQLAEEGKIDLFESEGGAPPEASGFNAAAQREKFLGGPAETTQIVPKAPETSQGFVGELLAVDAAAEGKLLVSIPQNDGGAVRLLKISEASLDKLPRTTFFGFDKDGYLRLTGPVAEEIAARLRNDNTEAHRFGQPIEGKSFEELMENSRDVLDASGGPTETARIDGENPDEVKRMERNLKMNLLNIQMEMGGKRDLVDHFATAIPTKGTVGAGEALQGALGQKS